MSQANVVHMAVPVNASLGKGIEVHQIVGISQ